MNPTVIATNQQLPSKMTFVPDLELYYVFIPNGVMNIYGHPQKLSGYLYWTNYNSTSGQLCRVRLVTNSAGNNLEVSGPVQIVADSLANSYDLIGPDDYRYVYFTGTSSGNQIKITGLSTGYSYNAWKEYEAKSSNIFKTLYVSSNKSGGTWYEIDITKYNGSTPLSANSPGISNYLSNSVDFPFNGKIQMCLLVNPTNPGVNQQAFKKDMFFTIYNFDMGSSSNASIYEQDNTFN
jgi:hypothetical protein